MLYLVIEAVFVLGLFTNAVLFIPQAIKLYKQKDSEELSMITFVGFTAINLFTALHALYRQDHFLLAGSSASFFTCGIVTYLIVYYRFNKFAKHPLK